MRVPVDTDDNAGIEWTPTTDGWHDLTVYATTRSGLQLAPYDYFFTVNRITPPGCLLEAGPGRRNPPPPARTAPCSTPVP